MSSETSDRIKSANVTVPSATKRPPIRYCTYAWVPCVYVYAVRLGTARASSQNHGHLLTQHHAHMWVRICMCMCMRMRGRGRAWRTWRAHDYTHLQRSSE